MDMYYDTSKFGVQCGVLKAHTPAPSALSVLIKIESIRKCEEADGEGFPRRLLTVRVI